jgi:hypothetical protein
MTTTQCPHCDGQGWTTGKDGAAMCLQCYDPAAIARRPTPVARGKRVKRVHWTGLIEYVDPGKRGSK